MFYVGFSTTSSYKIGYATSNDGITWEKKGVVDTIEPNVGLVGATKENDVYRIWYLKSASNTNYLYLTESD